MATHHIMTGSTTKLAPTASCPKTPPSCPTANQRDVTFSYSVRLFKKSSKRCLLRQMLICRDSLGHRFTVLPSDVSRLFQSTDRQSGAVRFGHLQEAGRVPQLPPGVPLWRQRSASILVLHPTSVFFTPLSSRSVSSHFRSVPG